MKLAKVWRLPGVEYPPTMKWAKVRGVAYELGKGRYRPDRAKELVALKAKRAANIAAGLTARGGIRKNKIRSDYLERHQPCK